MPFAPEPAPVDPAEVAAAIRIQAVFRGCRTRSMVRARPPESVSSSEALTDDDEDDADGAAVDEAVESAMPDDEVHEEAPAPAHDAHDDEDTYSWFDEYERRERRRWLLRQALKVLAVGAALGAARHAWLALAGRKGDEEQAAPAKKGGKAFAKLTGKKKAK